MFVRNSRTIYLECDFSKGHVPFWFQIAAIVKWLLVTRLTDSDFDPRYLDLGHSPQERPACSARTRF